MKKILLALLLSSVYSTTYAYRIEWGRNVVISRPVFEDLYIAGGAVTINAPVYGDLIVAGGTIHLNDTVLNDLLLAGGTVYINGFIADDIRCAGGELHLTRNVGGDVVITGGKVDIGRTATILGGLMASGGEVTMNGTVNGVLRTRAGQMQMNGTANSDLDCRADKLSVNGTVYGASFLGARSLLIGREASFNKEVRYWNRHHRVDFGQSLKNGNAVYDPGLKVASDRWYFLGHSTVLGLIWYITTVFLFILILQYLFSNTLKKAGSAVSGSVFKSLLWGFVFFLGVPLAVVLLLVSIIGMPVGLILMFSYIAILVLATIITSLVLANWYRSRFDLQWNYIQTCLAALAMFVLFKMISFTPFLGWLIMVLVALVAFGAILRNIDWRKRKVAVQ